MVISDVYMLLC